MQKAGKIMVPQVATSSTGRLTEENRQVRRKFMKHVVEKKRRGRINACLDELKALVLNALQKRPEDYEKMEKADILELTVQYVKRIKSRTQPSASPELYKAGYNTCMKEINQFFKSTTLENKVKDRLVNHLKKTRNSVPQSSLPCRSERSSAVQTGMPTHLVGVVRPSPLLPAPSGERTVQDRSQTYQSYMYSMYGQTHTASAFVRHSELKTQSTTTGTFHLDNSAPHLLPTQSKYQEQSNNSNVPFVNIFHCDNADINSNVWRPW